MIRQIAYVMAVSFALVAGAAGLGRAAPAFVIESLDMDLRAEVAAAAKDGKRLVVMFHQSGCPFCDKMRTHVFPTEQIAGYYGQHFVMVEANVRGELPVVTPDGGEMLEKEYARGKRVRATPVFVYYDPAGKEVLRITGYFDVPAFLAAGRYVVDEVYKDGTSLLTYINKGGGG